MFFLPLPFIEIARRHVIVELFTQKLNARTIAGIDGIVGILSIIFLLLLFVGSVREAIIQTSLREFLRGVAYQYRGVAGTLVLCGVIQRYGRPNDRQYDQKPLFMD